MTLLCALLALLVHARLLLALVRDRLLVPLLVALPCQADGTFITFISLPVFNA